MPLLKRSLLLREAAETGGACPVRALTEFLCCANAGDMLEALGAYHDFYAALLHAPVRRVSGDLWKDYLLHLLLLTPHAFARAAAAHTAGAELDSMLRAELDTLGALSTLTGTQLSRMARDKGRERRLKPRQARDDIEMFSNAVWSGGSARALPTPAAQKSAAVREAELEEEQDFPALHYGEPGLSESYAADEALEELYARLLEDGDWAKHREALRGFFAAYGCGPFLQSRALRYTQGRFLPLPESIAAPLQAPYADCFIAEREQIADNAIRFMQGEPFCHMHLCGGAGMGKSAQVYALLHELPAARLVLAEAKEPLFELFAALAAQPLRFFLLFDASAPDALEVPARALCPQNVCIVCTSREESAAADWAQRIHFPPLRPESFQDLVRSSLGALEAAAGESPALPERALANACVDYQVEARGRLSPRGAETLSRALWGQRL